MGWLRIVGSLKLYASFLKELYKRDYILQKRPIISHILDIGWLRLVGSLKWWVSFTEYSLFYRAHLQKRPIIWRSLLIVATPHHCGFQCIQGSLDHKQGSLYHTSSDLIRPMVTEKVYRDDRLHNVLFVFHCIKGSVYHSWFYVAT